MPAAALLLILLFWSPAPHATAPTGPIAWSAWNAEAFARAKAQDKPVFLYLEAVWCHWCHVMQRQTFAQPEVQARLARDFVVVRVDHDADPGLANRYRDYGWPALIFLSADGTDLVKRAGYIAPENFIRLLEAIARDPSPERETPPPVADTGISRLGTAARAYLLQRHDLSFDRERGGLRTAQKFVDRDSVEYALVHSERPEERIKAEKTLSAALALMDPVWGGVSQYSTGGAWSRPHYEKIMRTQAAYLRIYALAHARLDRPEDLQAARDIQRYLLRFLRSPEGAFYVSQDADLRPGEYSGDYFKLDDVGRRKLGLPRIDRNLYADANGAAAEALATLYWVSADPVALDAAVSATRWALLHRSGPNGLMHHGESDADATPHLSDSLSVGRAALALYEATGERQWLVAADGLGGAIDRQLRHAQAGFLTQAAVPGVPLAPRPDLAENIFATRWFNRLAHYTGKPAHRAAAEHGMRFLAGHAERQSDFEEAGILLADEELARDPVHLTVVGAKSDPQAQALFQTALRTPGSYRRIEWWDRAEGPLANRDVEYPDFARPAAYVCIAGRCSRPSYTGADYAQQIGRLTPASPGRPATPDVH